MKSHTVSRLRKLMVGGAVFGVSAGAGFVTISALDGAAPSPNHAVRPAPGWVAQSPTPAQVGQPSAEVEFVADVGRDLEATKALAGQVKVGDSCEAIDPALGEVSLDEVSVDALPMLPLVGDAEDGSCSVTGWVYASPLNAPDLGEPDKDGFVAIPVYGDDGSVIGTMEAPAETRESVKEFDANPNYQAGTDSSEPTP